MLQLARRVSLVVLLSALAGCWFRPYPVTSQPVVQPGPRVVQVAPRTYPTTQPPYANPTPPSPSGPLGPVQVVLYNNTGVEVCYLYIVVAGEPWGVDQLGDTGTIPVGTQVTLELPGDIPGWDVRADDCDRRTLYDVRNVALPGGVLELTAMFGTTPVPTYSGYASPTYEPTTYEPATVEPTYEPTSSGPAVDRRLGVVAGWFLGASMGDIEDLLRGDCGFIDNGDLQDFCRGDCGFIDDSNMAGACRAL